MTKQKNVFLYRFAFDGKFGDYKKLMTSNAIGAAHGDDLGYLFKNDFEANSEQYDTNNLTKEILIRERMVTMWTDFIKFG